jgi:ElaB/YqjD/DUF883 family membrane-anchored ribosome-binding protein
MDTKKKLLEHVKKIINETDDKDIRYVGPKPWYQRPLNKFKLGLAVGIATGLVSGLASFGLLSVVLNEQVEIGNQIASGKIQEVPVLKEAPQAKKKGAFAQALESFRKEHPNLNFANIKNAREVSKQFLGKNNFIALAAEMEGFRGDLHKDPATGLNIGFGYNISKRSELNPDEVIEDLTAIGVSRKKIDRIVEISKKKQKDLTKEIKKFNQEFKLEDNQLITLEQGVALLQRTEQEYKSQARVTFDSSFDKMDSHQQQVLTYAAYKAGYEALTKYKKAIKKAEKIYASYKEPGTKQLKSIAQELTFYYAKDGGAMVLDERATLIAHTFVSQDYLGLQIGKKDGLSQSPQKLYQQQIDFSHLDTTLEKKKSAQPAKPEIKAVKQNINNVLSKYRNHSQENKTKKQSYH